MAQQAQASASRFGNELHTPEFAHTVDLLDAIIPLAGASHAEVARYSVEIPMRYAECIAELSDGRKVGLKDPSCFEGWSSHKPRRSLLFKNGESHLEIETGEQQAICDITLIESTQRQLTAVRKFIGIDGAVLLIPAV